MYITNNNIHTVITVYWYQDINIGVDRADNYEIGGGGEYKSKCIRGTIVN